MNHILITGASSGIGEALALHYAVPGRLLSLLGRNSERTEAVASLCRAKGARVSAISLDVQDATAMEAWVRDRDHEQSLDLVIANAGVSAGSGGSGESAEQTRQIFSINVNGIFNTVLPTIELMRARQHLPA